MGNEKIYKGNCFCGEVQFEVSGEPAAMGYCHCESCRHWSAGPVNAFTLWKPDALKVTHGAGSIGTYNKTPISYRKWCKQCGGHLFTEHPTMGLVDIYAALIPKLPFEPGVHVHYQETVLHIRDGKTKNEGYAQRNGRLRSNSAGLTTPKCRQRGAGWIWRQPNRRFANGRSWVSIVAPRMTANRPV